LTGKLHAREAASAELAAGAAPDEPPPIDARGLGTLVHAALEEIDFGRPEDIAACVRRLAERHPPGDDASLEEAVAIVERFAASPRAVELASAAEMHRELEFLLAWPPRGGSAHARLSNSSHLPLGKGAEQNTSRQVSESAGRFLQGFIDCLYRGADGGWHLLDYKTNRGVLAENLSAAAAPYEMQMLVYGLAVETILQTPPEELTLCFLRPGLEYRFVWDAAARRRAVELVEEALASA